MLVLVKGSKRPTADLQIADVTAKKRPFSPANLRQAALVGSLRGGVSATGHDRKPTIRFDVARLAI